MDDKELLEQFEKRNRKPPTEFNNVASQDGVQSPMEENVVDKQGGNSIKKRNASTKSLKGRPTFLDNPELKRSLSIVNDRKEGGSMLDDDRLPHELAKSKLPTRKGRSGRDPVKALEALFDVDPTYDPIEILHPDYKQRAESDKNASNELSYPSDTVDISRDCIDIKAPAPSVINTGPSHEDQKIVPSKEEILRLRKKSREQSISNEEQKTRKSKKRGQRRKKTKGGEMYFIFFDANTSDCNRSIPPFCFEMIDPVARRIEIETTLQERINQADSNRTDAHMDRAYFAANNNIKVREARWRRAEQAKERVANLANDQARKAMARDALLEQRRETARNCSRIGKRKSDNNSQSTYNPQYYFPSRKEIQRKWPFNPVYDDVPTERRTWKAAHGGSDLEMIVPSFAQSKEALRICELDLREHIRELEIGLEQMLKERQELKDRIEEYEDIREAILPGSVYKGTFAQLRYRVSKKMRKLKKRWQGREQNDVK